jgi:DNA polymerase III delta prime subunit
MARRVTNARAIVKKYISIHNVDYSTIAGPPASAKTTTGLYLAHDLYGIYTKYCKLAFQTKPASLN